MSTRPKRTGFRAREVFQLSRRPLLALWPRIVFFWLISLFIPQVTLSYLGGHGAHKAVERMRGLMLAKAALQTDGEFLAKTLDAAGDFVTGYMGVVVLFWVMGVWAYFALVRDALEYSRDGHKQPLSKVMFEALKKAVPSGVVFSGLFLAISALSQSASFPALVLAVLAMIAPVVMSEERVGALRGFFRAAGMRYARRGPFSGLNAFFPLFTLGVCFYLLELALTFLAQTFATAPLWWKTAPAFLTAHVPQTPFSYAFLTGEFFDVFFGTALIAILPCVSVSYYLIVTGERDLDAVPGENISTFV